MGLLSGWETQLLQGRLPSHLIFRLRQWLQDTDTRRRSRLMRAECAVTGCIEGLTNTGERRCDVVCQRPC